MPATTTPTAGAAASARRERKTQAERRAASKRRLLDATAKLIAERGTTNVSFVEIAKQAGCSHGLPGYLFGSKNDLLVALVADGVVNYGESLVEPVGDRRGLDALLAVVRSVLERLADHDPQTRSWYVMLGEAPGLPQEVRDALGRYHEVVRAVVRGALLEGIETGQVRADVDVDAQAVVVVATVRGIAQQILMIQGAVDVPAVTDAAVENLRLALTATP